MNIFPLKTYISVVVLLVEGSVQGAVRKKLINVSPIMLFKAVTLRKLEAVIEHVMQKKVFLHLLFDHKFYLYPSLITEKIVLFRYVIPYDLINSNIFFGIGINKFTYCFLMLLN